jgi:hypothetical protein|tara:strand:- start:512 stop:898 length:387 start_codon:yes stop_codon:yes gene_type:complete
MPTKKEITAHRHYWVDLYKKSNGCYLCGYNRHPSALCFDHLPDVEKAELTKNGCSKRSCAGGMYQLYNANIPFEYLIEEIKKCRVLCCNCHMECTHNKNERVRIVTHEQLTVEYLSSILEKFENEQRD